MYNKSCYFNDCLEHQLRNDKDGLESCLARHPDEALELCQLLKTAGDIGRYGEKVKPRREFVARMEAHLAEAYHSKYASHKGTRLVRAAKYWAFSGGVAVIAAFFTFTGGFAIVAAAFQNTPVGHLIHPSNQVTIEEAKAVISPSFKPPSVSSGNDGNVLSGEEMPNMAGFSKDGAGSMNVFQPEISNDNAADDSGSPGNSGSAPGHQSPGTDDSSSPGNSGSAPGHQSSGMDDSGSPGNSDSAPGHQPSGMDDSSSPGNSDSAPGHQSPGTDDSSSPGNSDSAPGHQSPGTDDSSSPGNSDSAPGHQSPGTDDSSSPGNSDSAPGHQSPGN